MRRSLATAAFVSLLLAATNVFAGAATEEASAWFRQGEAAFARGDAWTAAESFEHAHRLVPHGATAYNIGLAWQTAGELARAAQAFAECLDRGGLSKAQASDATKRMEALSSKLALVHFSGPQGSKISVAHVRHAPTPVDTYLKPGEHVVAVVLADGEEHSQRVLVRVGSQAIEVQLPHASSSDEVGPAGSAGSRRTLGWVAAGGAGVLSGLAVYLGVEALDARDSFNDSGHTDGEAHDRAASLRTWTNVAWVGAGASAVTGVVLLLGSEEEQGSSQTSSARVCLGAGRVSVHGRW